MGLGKELGALLTLNFTVMGLVPRFNHDVWNEFLLFLPRRKHAVVLLGIRGVTVQQFLPAFFNESFLVTILKPALWFLMWLP